MRKAKNTNKRKRKEKEPKRKDKENTKKYCLFVCKEFIITYMQRDSNEVKRITSF